MGDVTGENVVRMRNVIGIVDSPANSRSPNQVVSLSR